MCLRIAHRTCCERSELRVLAPLGVGHAKCSHIITVDDEVYEALQSLSKKRDEAVAGVGLDLIEEALEYQEDLYFS